jgi:hypothetical protein
MEMLIIKACFVVVAFVAIRIIYGRGKNLFI